MPQNKPDNPYSQASAFGPANPGLTPKLSRQNHLLSACPYLLHIPFNPFHLVQPDLVDLIGRQVCGGVEAQALGVVALTVRQRSRRDRGTRVREVFRLHEVSWKLQRRYVNWAGQCGGCVGEMLLEDFRNQCSFFIYIDEC